ncbi:TnsD family transposase [Viridibacillus arvi]|uniref:TnsD family transposase n=1 Tax=Viridibacillus arvi TaxID=263475 RepID=UPI0036E75227
MLGFIPKMYPDELLYSFVARYHAYSKNISINHTVFELFTYNIQISTPDLPINLKSLFEQIKVFNTIELEEILGKHTFFNFYTNFIGEEAKNFVKNAMYTGVKKGAIHMKTGVMASGVKEKKYFCYCTDCLNEDIQQFGETYWHLTHQLPGVMVCTKHKAFLEESDVLFRSKERLEFYTASNTIKISFLRKDNKQKVNDTLLVIAKECTALAFHNFNFDLKRLQVVYKSLLLRQGFIIGKEVVDQEKLASSFESYYGNELLRKLQSTVSYDNPSCWLKSITRKHRKSFHAIRHILFIVFLQENLESISKMEYSDNLPFGKGPYPCLNKTAKHYRELTITDIEVRVCYKTKVTMGIFRCHCGFHYLRKGFDKNKSDRYKIGRVLQFGDVWIDEVKKLINEQKLRYRLVARRLGVDTKTVIKYSKEPIIIKNDNIDLRKREVAKKQAKWLSLIKDNDGLGVTKLRSKEPALYNWLYRNCREWHKANSPKEKRDDSKRIIDWKQRDYEMEEEVLIVAENLLRVNPPVRITLSRIGNEVGKRSLLEKHLESLPRTKTTLEQIVEDIPSFQIRRLHIIVNQLKDEKQIKEWKLRRIAGLKREVDERVEIEIKKILNDKC